VQHGMATFCKPFTKATTRYFDHADAAEREVVVRSVAALAANGTNECAEAHGHAPDCGNDRDEQAFSLVTAVWTKTSPSNFGTVVSVRGSVVEYPFRGTLPPIYTVLHAGDEQRIVIEVLAQRDARHVRGIG